MIKIWIKIMVWEEDMRKNKKKKRKNYVSIRTHAHKHTCPHTNIRNNLNTKNAETFYSNTTPALEQ